MTTVIGGLLLLGLLRGAFEVSQRQLHASQRHAQGQVELLVRAAVGI